MQNISVKLGDKTVELIPTLKAARSVNHFKGGFTGALRALQQDGDMQTVAVCIAAGTDKTAPDEIDAIEEAVFSSGVNDLLQPCVQFVVRLMNGGRDPAKAEGKDTKNGKPASA